nr:MAG TPA: distal tail protein [Caudoviricetes sp.]
MSLSVKFNDQELGKYLNVLSGFSPFNGVDRETELLESAESCKGEEFGYSTYKSRVIEMPFELIGDIAESYNKIQKILNVSEPKRLVFGNYPNRYFYAIPNGNLDITQVSIFGKGTITWIIPDGVAYSVAEFNFDGVQQDGYQTITIQNNGTEWADVDYEITHEHENGFIGLISQYGIIQLGKEEEADGETYKASEVLAKGFGKFATDHGTSAQNPSNTTNGILEVRDVAGNNCLLLARGQSGSANWWNGGMKTITIPADSEGATGSKNFYCYTQHWFETGLMGQTGAQTIAFLTGDNQVICAMSINKSDLVGNMAHVDWFGPKNKLLKSIDFSPTNGEGNPYNLKMGGGHNDFLKEGDRLRIFWYGQYFTYTLPEIKNMECKKVQIWIGQWGNRNLANQYVTRNYIKHFSFTKNNVEKYRDIPNRYKAGDVVTIDGESAKVLVNGMSARGDEITGTDYFKVPPGTTEVQFCYSSFSSPPPRIRAKIREVYL